MLLQHMVTKRYLAAARCTPQITLGLNGPPVAGIYITLRNMVEC